MKERFCRENGGLTFRDERGSYRLSPCFFGEVYEREERALLLAQVADAADIAHSMATISLRGDPGEDVMEAALRGLAAGGLSAAYILIEWIDDPTHGARVRDALRDALASAVAAICEEAEDETRRWDEDPQRLRRMMFANITHVARYVRLGGALPLLCRAMNHLCTRPDLMRGDDMRNDDAEWLVQAAHGVLAFVADDPGAQDARAARAAAHIVAILAHPLVFTRHIAARSWSALLCGDEGLIAIPEAGLAALRSGATPTLCDEPEDWVFLSMAPGLLRALEPDDDARARTIARLLSLANTPDHANAAVRILREANALNDEERLAEIIQTHHDARHSEAFVALCETLGDDLPQAHRASYHEHLRVQLDHPNPHRRAVAMRRLPSLPQTQRDELLAHALRDEPDPYLRRRLEAVRDGAGTFFVYPPAT